MDDLVKELLKDVIEYMKGTRKAIPQENHHAAVYAHKISKQESLVIWSQPAINIFNQVRALVTGPQAYTLYKGKRLKIYRAKPVSFENKSAPPGQILKIDSNGFVVACREDSIKVLQVQPESKKVMLAGEYLRGGTLKLGDILGEKV